MNWTGKVKPSRAKPSNIVSGSANKIRSVSRRQFLRNAVLGASAVTIIPMLGCRSGWPQKAAGAASRNLPLDNDWLFGGRFSDAAAQPAFDDSAFVRVSLPHCVSKLSWQGWEFSDWADVWVYRRHFSLPEGCGGQRIFLHFEGVMTGATPFVNGYALPPHRGGYLPFRYEITQLVGTRDNVLAVAVDARWSNVPPQGNPKGPISVDFLQPGGIHRPVTLCAVPQLFISDVFAKPVNVLDPSRRVEISCTLDAAIVPKNNTRLKVELFDAGRRIADISQAVEIETTGKTEWKLTLANLDYVKLWDVSAPQLYDLVTTLIVDDKPVHDYRTRIGFREAKFALDGFHLNGRRLQLFGLCRHEIYPYVGFAMPPRVMRRDAEILRHELNCNAVRCSHYPQTEAFLDACDELGLLVWEEMPGWGFLGDDGWKELALRDVETMIRRDRNHPAIVIWGVRVNESKNDPALYQRTTALAKSLDDSRPTSGAMVGGLHSTKDWQEDVFAYNDYAHDAKTGELKLNRPLPGVPYILTEAVGQVVGIGPSEEHRYRRAGEPALQAKQAIYHAQAHDQAAADKQFAGVIAWCGFEYASPVKVAYNAVKNPGVADVFRIPKLGASFYQAQVHPQVRPVIQPNFYWDFGAKTPRGPGKNAAIFSNCDHLEVFLNGAKLATLQPRRDQFPHLAYPPFFADLDLDGTGKPELRLDGYVGGALALSRSFSADETQDQFLLRADDARLTGTGFDATRLVFGRVDKFGSVRLFGTGEVTFQISGPGAIVGDNPFQLGDSGGIAAVWIKAEKNGVGNIEVAAAHPTLGKRSVIITV